MIPRPTVRNDQTRGLETAEVNFHIVLETRCLKARCGEVMLSLRALGEDLSQASLPAFGGQWLGVLGL